MHGWGSRHDGRNTNTPGEDNDEWRWLLARQAFTYILDIPRTLPSERIRHGRTQWPCIKSAIMSLASTTTKKNPRHRSLGRSEAVSMQPNSQVRAQSEELVKIRGHGNGHGAWHCRGRDDRRFYLSPLLHHFVPRRCFGKWTPRSCATRLDTSDVTLMRWASVQWCGPCAFAPLISKNRNTHHLRCSYSPAADLMILWPEKPQNQGGTVCWVGFYYVGFYAIEYTFYNINKEFISTL